MPKSITELVAINVGNTTGQIDTTGSLAIKALGAAADLSLEAGLELKLIDGNQVLLQNDMKLPIGKSYRKTVLHYIENS